MRDRHGEAVKAWKATNQLPAPCAVCGDPVTELGRRRGEGVVHHRDDDPTNNAPENLALKHAECHVRFHHKDKPKGPFSEKHRAAISVSAKRRGMPRSVIEAAAQTPRSEAQKEHLRQLSEAQRGKPLSNKTKKKMSEAQQRRWASYTNERRSEIGRSISNGKRRD